MARPKKPRKFSAVELRLMAVLWERGPLTLAEFYEVYPGNAAYTTVQTQLNRLVKKRSVAKSSGRPTKYRAVMGPQEAASTALETMVATVGRGSIFPVVEQLVSLRELSRDEVRELKRLIDQTNRKTKSANRASQRIKKKK